MEPGKAKLTVLLIEDDQKFAAGLGSVIGDSRDFELRHAELVSAGLTELSKGRIDVVLLDLFLPDSRGLETFMRVHAGFPDVPIIVLSGSSDESVAIETVRRGAQDYVDKADLDVRVLLRATRYAIERKRLQKRTDELLDMILPHEVVGELKRTNTVKPRRFEHVGVLFCDIAGFTAFCDEHRPGEILRYLQSVVEAFEQIAAEHQLEKIKTIGDCFMATSGLLVPVTNPALKCVGCGLAMAAASEALPPHWQVRVGVHVGPVIAGIVGQKKFQYDIWGDTVNTAARIQGTAHPGSVCVNSETWRLLSEDCVGHSQGKIQIKGKGEQEIFRVDKITSP